MVEFWGIFVVFSACAAVQITEARTYNAYVSDISSEEFDASSKLDKYVPLHVNEIPSSLEHTSAESDQSTYTDPPKRFWEDSSEESDEHQKVPTRSNKRLSLGQRRQRLYDFSIEAISKYEKDFVRQTRQLIKEILHELEALPEKSKVIVEKITELSEALTEIDEDEVGDDDDKTDFSLLESAMDVVGYLNLEPENASPEFEAVLEKVGLVSMRKEFSGELNGLIKEFGKKLDVFVKTLTPWERLTSSAFVDLHKRFTKANAVGKWHLLNEFWMQFAD